MIAILGGGISGLTLAWHLQKAGVACHLFEAGDRPGGNLRSELVDGYLLETGPNSVQLSPELEELLADLDLTDQLQDTAAVSANRYVLRDGRYRRLPGKPQQLLFSSFFSLKARYDILRELTRPAAPPDELETLAGFFRRRFDQEIVDYALNPFISGIYAGDPEQLLLHKTFPKLAALEQTYGSVLRGLAKSGGAGQRRRIVSLRGGLHALTNALAARLTHYRGGQRLTGLTRQPDGRYQLQTAAGPLPAAYDAVALALPAYAAAELLRASFPVQAAALAAVQYPAMSAIYTAYPRAAVGPSARRLRGAAPESGELLRGRQRLDQLPLPRPRPGRAGAVHDLRGRHAVRSAGPRAGGYSKSRRARGAKPALRHHGGAAYLAVSLLLGQSHSAI